MNSSIFKTAKFRLSLWYMLILATVLSVFSLVIFTSLNAELLRAARREQQKIVAEKLRINLPVPLPDPQKLPKELVNPTLNEEIKALYITERNNLISQIMLANFLVLLFSASASYFLAGKTLQPIELMLAEQKIFVANASHELRTPLTALKTSLEVSLKMGAIPYIKVKKLLESNLEDVERLEKLSNRLLSMEKFSDLSSTSFTEVDIGLLLDVVIARFDSLAKKHKVTCIKRYKQVSVFGDRNALDELLSVLIENALKYNKKNGRVTISVIKQVGLVQVVVQDTGAGIHSVDLHHIFERFYQAQQSRSEVGGHGLGLAIAAEIVQAHHGKISVSSVFGEGSAFTVSLPSR